MKLLSLWSIRLFEEMCEACECEYRRGDCCKTRVEILRARKLFLPSETMRRGREGVAVSHVRAGECGVVGRRRRTRRSKCGGGLVRGRTESVGFRGNSSQHKVEREGGDAATVRSILVAGGGGAKRREKG